MTDAQATPTQPRPAQLDQVSAICVTYNSAHCLQDLHPALSALPHVFVVDNASNDGCAATARQLWPHAHVLEMPRNMGFGAANNRALEKVETPFALLLNPDCHIDCAQIAALVQTAQSDWPEAAILAPQLIDGHDKAEVNYSWPRHAWTARGPGASGPLCVGYACAAVWLLNMANMRAVGFFDEGFFLYYEDEDLALRAFQARAPIVLVPQIRVHHASRGSVRGKHPWRAEYVRGFHHVQSKLRFAHKHHLRRPSLPILMATSLGLLLLRLLLPSPKHIARVWGRICGVAQFSHR